ncbi:MAG: DUF2283 domain-containing protein [Anaerolineae bacterium]
MRITYDPDVDALYIRLIDEAVQATTERLSDDIAVDYAPDGRIAGIEVLDASRYTFTSGPERRVVLENLIAVAG